MKRQNTITEPAQQTLKEEDILRVALIGEHQNTSALLFPAAIQPLTRFSSVEEVGQVDRGVLSGGVQQVVDIKEERVVGVLLPQKVKAHHEVGVLGVQEHCLLHVGQNLVGRFEPGGEAKL